MVRTFREIARLALCCATVLAAWGCDSPSGRTEPGPPARLDVISGDLQNAPVGTELPQPLVARVVDANGTPVPNQVVNFRVISGGGTVFAGSGQTNAQGEVRERWTLGTLGVAAGDTQRVEARAVDATTGAALVLGVFRAVGTAGAPASFASIPNPIKDEGLVTRALGEPLEVVLLDAWGNRVPGASVIWTGQGSFNPAVSVTDAQGRATTVWTLGTTVGRHDATATAGTATATFTTYAITSPEIPGRMVLRADTRSLEVGDSAGVPNADWVDVHGNTAGIYPLDPALQ